MKIVKKADNTTVLKISMKEWLKIGESNDWIQHAVPESHKGRFTEYCKRKGHDGVTDGCISEAIKEGGHAAKMAEFAKTMREGK